MRENHTLPRLHVTDGLALDVTIELPREQAHYLTTVIRKSVGDALRVFNGRDGEWRAEITQTSKRSVVLTVTKSLREAVEVPDVTLLFAPVRKHRTAFIVEKATELGVRTLQPILTARTQFPRFNAGKARLQAIEAAEQTERLDVPEVRDAVPLKDILAGWDDRPILFADEAGGKPIGDVCLPAPLALLTGPEGGFTPEERAELHGMTQVTAVSLGPRILRADTAALAMLALWQSADGDWNA